MSNAIEFKIVKNDTNDSDLDLAQLGTVRAIFEHFDGRLEETVYQDETAHGQILTFIFREQYVIPQETNAPLRMDLEDLKFWNTLDIRWLEAAGGSLTVGL